MRPAGKRSIANVEHDAARCRLLAIEPRHPPAECGNALAQPELLQHELPARLQEQARPQGLGFGKALNKDNPVSEPVQKKRSRQPRWPAAANGDIEMWHQPAIILQRSALSARKASLSAIGTRRSLP